MEENPSERSSGKGSSTKSTRKTPRAKKSAGKVVGEAGLSTESAVRKVQLLKAKVLLHQIIGRRKVNIVTSVPGHPPRTEEMEVYLLKAYPFLCWHPCPASIPWGWGVTHTESGLALCMGLYGPDLALGLTVDLSQSKVGWHKLHAEVMKELASIKARRNRVGIAMRKFIRMSLERRARSRKLHVPKAYLKGERHRALLQAIFEGYLNCDDVRVETV